MDQAQGQSEPSIRERIGAALGASQEQPQEQPEQQVAEPDPQQTETQDPAEQEAQAQPDPTADWEDVELEGEKLAVPPKFREAFLKNADYTQKTQALAETRKALDAKEAALRTSEQVLSQLQPAVARQFQIKQEIESIQRQVQANPQLEYEDPVRFATLKSNYAALGLEQQQIAGYLENGKSHLQQAQQQALMESVRAAEPQLRKLIPDWGPDKERALGEFALKHGATPEELRGLAARPWAVGLMEKARLYDELQVSKTQLTRKVANLSPVAKPGAKQTVQSTEAASYRKNRDEFRKSGGKDSASLKALLRAHLR